MPTVIRCLWDLPRSSFFIDDSITEFPISPLWPPSTKPPPPSGLHHIPKLLAGVSFLVRVLLFLNTQERKTPVNHNSQQGYTLFGTRANGGRWINNKQMDKGNNKLPLERGPGSDTCGQSSDGETARYSYLPSGAARLHGHTLDLGTDNGSSSTIKLKQPTLSTVLLPSAPP